MSCDEAREQAAAVLARLIEIHEQIMEIHSQAWTPERARIALWSLNREERTLHLEWTRLEDAFLAALSEHQ